MLNENLLEGNTVYADKTNVVIVTEITFQSSVAP